MLTLKSVSRVLNVISMPALLRQVTPTTVMSPAFLATAAVSLPRLILIRKIIAIEIIRISNRMKLIYGNVLL